MSTVLQCSAEPHDQAKQLTPGGVHSNVRLSAPPIFFERGSGAWLWDVDGRVYVDYLLGQGPNFLGHAPARVNEVRDYTGLAVLDLHRYATFASTLADHGIWVAARGIWYVSAAHGDSEMAATTDRLAAATAAEAKSQVSG